VRLEQARHRSLFTRVASPRTRSLASSPSCLVKGRRVASSYPGAPSRRPPFPAGGPRSPRERCVSPTSATDFRHEHPADRSIPGRAHEGQRSRAARSSTRAHPGPGDLTGGDGSWETCQSACRMSHPGGASLDGEPPASVRPRPSRDPPKGCPRARPEPRPRPFTCVVQRSPGGARSMAPPRQTSCRRCSRPPDRLTTRPLTSSCAPERIRHRCRIPVAPDRRARRSRRLVKDADLAAPGRLPSPSAPSPGRTVRLRGRAWDHEEPATGVAARVLAAFAAATRLPAPFRHLSSPAGAGSQGARPMTLRYGPSAARRLLQPTRSASTAARSSDPRSGCEPRPACARALRSPRSPASARARRGRSPLVPSPPRVRVVRSRSHARRRPCTEHGQRCRRTAVRGRSPARLHGQLPAEVHGSGAG
jgi:hypothetical protein